MKKKGTRLGSCSPSDLRRFDLNRTYLDRRCHGAPVVLKLGGCVGVDLGNFGGWEKRGKTAMNGDERALEGPGYHGKWRAAASIFFECMSTGIGHLVPNIRASLRVSLK